MKTSVIIFVAVCAGVAGGVVYFGHRKASPPPDAVVQSPSPIAIAPEPAAEKIADSKPELSQTVSNAKAVVETPVPPQAAAPAINHSSSTSIGKAVDALLSAKSGAQKHEMFQQLVQSGQIDEAIAELKQRAADNPNDPEIPTTLGEAQLNKVKAMHDTGGDYNEMGILAMQADQSFNAALKIDPQNWEAQFVKNSSMYYWPANPQVDNQVVQQLSSLIDQQETMSSRPDFAQTYTLLGNEYQKIGQPDKAMATWQLGAQKYPSDPTLQQKINGQ
jgi:tetratricopeptide (TPR) repeat protein